MTIRTKVESVNSGHGGRGHGPCGRGEGRGGGRGQGCCHDSGHHGNQQGRIWVRRYAGTAPEADRAALEEQVRLLEGDLGAAREELARISDTNGGDKAAPVEESPETKEE